MLGNITYVRQSPSRPFRSCLLPLLKLLRFAALIWFRPVFVAVSDRSFCYKTWEKITGLSSASYEESSRTKGRFSGKIIRIVCFSFASDAIQCHFRANEPIWKQTSWALDWGNQLLHLNSGSRVKLILERLSSIFLMLWFLVFSFWFLASASKVH